MKNLTLNVILALSVFVNIALALCIYKLYEQPVRLVSPEAIMELRSPSGIYTTLAAYEEGSVVAVSSLEEEHIFMKLMFEGKWLKKIYLKDQKMTWVFNLHEENVSAEHIEFNLVDDGKAAKYELVPAAIDTQ